LTHFSALEWQKRHKKQVFLPQKHVKALHFYSFYLKKRLKNALFRHKKSLKNVFLCQIEDG